MNNKDGVLDKKYVNIKGVGLVGYVKLINDHGKEVNVEVAHLYEKTWLKKEQQKYYKEIEELKKKCPKLTN